MVKTSIQAELGKTRPPRVKIAYEVQTGDATEKKELPFVVGVLGDFTGNPEKAPPKLKDRKFIEIDRDTFDKVMSRMAPELNMAVENTLKDDGSEIGVKLKFNSMQDFQPGRIVEQVKPLKELLEARQKLTELKTKVELGDNLEDKLKDLLSNNDQLKAAAEALGGVGSSDTESDSDES